MSLQPATPPKPRGEVYFHFVGMAVNDLMVVTANRNIPLQDIRASRIVSRRYAVNWRKRLLEQARYAVITLAIFYAASFFFSHAFSWTLFVGYSIGQLWRTLWPLKKQSAEHVLVLETGSGYVEVARSDSKVHLQTAAREIGRRIANVAPDSVVLAVKEPAEITVRVDAEPPSLAKPLEYDWADVTIEQQAVKIHSRVYPVEDILRAEVRKEVKPMLYFAWIGLGMWLTVFACAFFMPAFWSALVPMIILEFFQFGAIGLANRGMQEWTRTHKYTVVMETRYEVIEIASTSRILGSNSLARNINRIVKEHLLIATPPSAAQLTAGAPTERV